MRIVRPRRYRSQPDRIHYHLILSDGTGRWLYVDKSAKGGLYTELEKLLAP